MRRLTVLVLLSAVLTAHVATWAPALARSAEPQAGASAPRAQEADGDDRDVVPVAAWTIAGVGMFAVVGAVLYFVKRGVGGFPANPSWKAPISIERSETFPAEGDYGDVAPDSHGAHH
jgi:hypothetical protein